MLERKRNMGGGIMTTFLISFAISVLLILLLSLLSALIVGSLEDPTKLLGLFSLGSLLISAAISGVISTRMKGEGGLGFAALVALSVVLIMLLINVIICSGKVSGASFMNYGCYMGVAVLSAFLGKKRDRHRKHRY